MGKYGVTVDYATLDGTATAGADYTGIATTQLVFGPTDTTQQIVVSITDDGRSTRYVCPARCEMLAGRRWASTIFRS